MWIEKEIANFLKELHVNNVHENIHHLKLFLLILNNNPLHYLSMSIQAHLHSILISKSTLQILN